MKQQQQNSYNKYFALFHLKSKCLMLMKWKRRKTNSTCQSQTNKWKIINFYSCKDLIKHKNCILYIFKVKKKNCNEYEKDLFSKKDQKNKCLLAIERCASNIQWSKLPLKQTKRFRKKKNTMNITNWNFSKA